MYVKYDQSQGWRSVKNFCKMYVSPRKGTLGITRQYAFQLIQQEQEKPNTTGIDILDVDGVLFLRLNNHPVLSEGKPIQGTTRKGRTKDKDQPFLSTTDQEGKPLSL